MRAKAKITEWDDAKGYGWLEVAEGRLFLHIKEIKKRKHWPKVGDLVAYDVGQDPHGRSCAQNVEQTDAGGRFVPDRILFLAVLIVAPVVALCRLSALVSWRMVAVVAVGVNILSLGFYWIDKCRAETNQWRISEGSLHLLELLGGWPGAFLAQQIFRHKTAKIRYQIVFWMIVAGYEYAAVDFLLGWKITHEIVQLLGR